MSSPVWDRLIYIVEQELEEMNRATTTADYTDAAWSHKQAHRNGKRDALTGILKLLKKR